MALCPLVLLLTGCTQKLWVKNYEPVSDQRFERTDARAVKFEEVDYATLQNTRDLPGYTTLGEAGFRDKALDVTPGAKDSSLREQAALCGANYVRWASRSVTTVSQGRGYVSAYGGSSYSDTHEVFDYYAVFYRKQ
jgi:hypothetical protein